MIKLQSYRSRFALESPVGLHAYWSVGQNGNVKSIEVLDGGIVLMHGNSKWWVILGESIGVVSDEEAARMRGEKPKTSAPKSSSKTAGVTS